MRGLVRAAVSIAIATVAMSARGQVVVPSSYTNTPAEFQVAGAAGIRYQQVFAASEFWPAAETHPIYSVNWRLGSALWPGTYTWSIPRIDVWLATTPQTPSGLSPVFADNYAGSSDRTLVYSGPITFSGTVLAGQPNGFDIKIPLQVPFQYRPGSGNLLLDIVDYDFYANLWERQVDLAASSSVTNYAATDYRYAVGDVGRFAPGTGGLVTQFSSDYVPAAPTFSVSLKFNPTSVAGGKSSKGTITLSAPAPSTGLKLLLASDNGAVKVPASVTVQAGATTASFTAKTTLVAAETTASVSATAGTYSATANLTVNPATSNGATILSFTLGSSYIDSGGSESAKIYLTAPAPAGGVTIKMTSSNSAVAQVPASLWVPGGESRVEFTVQAGIVTSNRTVTLSATLGTQVVKRTVTVTP